MTKSLLLVALIPCIASTASAQSWTALAARAPMAFETLVEQGPAKWGCTEASVDRPTSIPATSIAGTTPIPPSALDENLSDLRIGLPFPRISPHNLSLTPEQVAGAERDFCARDAELNCADGAARSRLIADLTRRIARIASNPALSAVARAATMHVRDDLARGSMPVVLFGAPMRSGPTAAAIRYRDPRTGRWILGFAFASDFATSKEETLFLDGVLLQEMVHYDDVAYLPDPFRCYESNMEIRGHQAMMSYWKLFQGESATSHPRIQLAASAELDDASPRAKWYRYLNRVEKTDFRVEDLLVSLEFRTLPALSPDRTDDTRFLEQVSGVVSSALVKAGNLRRNVARLPSDSINGDARVISAVANLVPRVLSRYEHTRGNLRGPDGATRESVMAAPLSAIRMSLAALGSLMGALAADPDFRRKSDFVGTQ